MVAAAAVASAAEARAAVGEAVAMYGSSYRENVGLGLGSGAGLGPILGAGGGGGGAGEGGAGGPPRPGNWGTIPMQLKEHWRRRGGKVRLGPNLKYSRSQTDLSIVRIWLRLYFE